MRNPNEQLFYIFLINYLFILVFAIRELRIANRELQIIGIVCIIQNYESKKTQWNETSRYFGFINHCTKK